MPCTHSWLVFLADQEHILNMSSPIQAKGTVAVQLDMGYKLVRILFIIGDCIMIVLIACSFSTQYNGVYISLLNSAGS